MTPNNPSSSSRMTPIETQLISQALQDAAFRDRLIADPKAVLAEQGLTVPENVQVQVLQETASQYYLVLPVNEDAAIALSDQELEAVSGGSTNAIWPNSCVASTPSSSSSSFASPSSAEPTHLDIEIY